MSACEGILNGDDMIRFLSVPGNFSSKHDKMILTDRTWDLFSEVERASLFICF